MYVQGFIVPVPADKKEASRLVAEQFWPIAQDYGCLGHVEAWEADIKDGEATDFRRAVHLKPCEKVVFSGMTWPDRATADAAHEQMISDERMKHREDGATMSFGKRMVFGGFDVIVEKEV